MAEPLGLVPQRREGTGAAQILQPFNSAPIFQAYDQSMVQPKRPLMDSFGKDLNAGDGKVHPNDRWWIKEAQNKYFDSAAKIMARLQAEKRDLNADEQRELTLLKQDVADRVGVAQKQFEGWNAQSSKVAESPYAYNPDERKQFETYFDQKITDRPLFPGINKIPDTDIVKWVESIGDPTTSTRTKTVRPDGTSVEVDKITFDPKKASELYDTTVLPLLSSTQQGRVLTDMIKDDIISQDPSFTSLPPADQAEIVDMAIKDYYINTKKNQYRYKNDVVRDNQPSKTGGSGTKTPTVSDLEPVVERVYMVHDAKGNRVLGKFNTDPDKNTTVYLRDVVSYPVAGFFGSRTPQENSEKFVFKVGARFVKGSPQQIRTYKGASGKWSDYSLLLAGEDGVIEEVLLTGPNRTKIEKEFGFSLDELEKKFPNAKKQAEEMPVTPVEDMPSWNSKTEAEQAVYRKAWERRFGKGASTQQATTPAKGNTKTASTQQATEPATSQTPAASKYIQQYGRSSATPQTNQTKKSDTNSGDFSVRIVKSPSFAKFIEYLPMDKQNQAQAISYLEAYKKKFPDLSDEQLIKKGMEILK